MVNRLLGGVSLVIGAIFALITLLVLLPFLNNFNTSLLVLAAIFAVFAWVFLGIGWQLLHPPRSRREPPAGEASEPEEPLEEPMQAAPRRSGPVEATATQESKDSREHHLRAPRTF
jgi:hypothetical protein